ncbi:MAG: EpsI family protein [Sphingomonadaceae bacterium]|jgi:EpsI family protein
MIARRDFLFGGACVAALGVAEALRPRTLLTLMPSDPLTQLVPTHMGAWVLGEGGDIVTPKVPGSLSDKLYSDTLTRLYVNTQTGEQVMLLVAYGRAQSDILQLHRPESCYPAIGLAIQARKNNDIPLKPGVTIPAVALTAGEESRIEDIVYWTRLGEYLPRTAGDQRRDRLQTAMEGIIGDGVLVRASMLRQSHDMPPKYDRLNEFMASLITGMKPTNRPGFIGSERAKQIA